MRSSATPSSRSRPGQRFVRFAFRCPLEKADHLGQQIGPPVRECPELGQRLSFLVLGEIPPPCPVAGLPRDLRYEDTVSLRAIIGHAFEYRQPA